MLMLCVIITMTLFYSVRNEQSWLLEYECVGLCVSSSCQIFSPSTYWVVKCPTPLSYYIKSFLHLILSENFGPLSSSQSLGKNTHLVMLGTLCSSLGFYKTEFLLVTSCREGVKEHKNQTGGEYDVSRHVLPAGF